MGTNVSGAHVLEAYKGLVATPDTVSLPGIGHYPQVEAPEAVLAAWQGLVRTTD